MNNVGLQNINHIYFTSKSYVHIICFVIYIYIFTQSIECTVYSFTQSYFCHDFFASPSFEFALRSEGEKGENKWGKFFPVNSIDLVKRYTYCILTEIYMYIKPQNHITVVKHLILLINSHSAKTVKLMSFAFKCQIFSPSCWHLSCIKHKVYSLAYSYCILWNDFIEIVLQFSQDKVKYIECPK